MKRAQFFQEGGDAKKTRGDSLSEDSSESSEDSKLFPDIFKTIFNNLFSLELNDSFNTAWLSNIVFPNLLEAQKYKLSSFKEYFDKFIDKIVSSVWTLSESMGFTEVELKLHLKLIDFIFSTPSLAQLCSPLQSELLRRHKVFLEANSAAPEQNKAVVDYINYMKESAKNSSTHREIIIKHRIAIVDYYSQYSEAKRADLKTPSKQIHKLFEAENEIKKGKNKVNKTSHNLRASFASIFLNRQIKADAFNFSNLNFFMKIGLFTLGNLQSVLKKEIKTTKDKRLDKNPGHS